MMGRRNVLALAGTAGSTLLAGCLNGVPVVGITREDLPEWPDEPTESAVTSYAARYRVVEVHNRTVDRSSERYYRELSHGVDGAFEAETTAGFVIMTSGGGGSKSRRGVSRNDLVGEIMLPPEALLASENEVIQAPVDHRWEDLDDPSDPPFSTRGLSFVNFSSEDRRIDVSIESPEDSDDAPLFAETFELKAEHGRTELEVVDGPGEYEVGVSVGDDDAVYQWSVSDEPRELTDPYVGGTRDVGLGIYVLPDGTVEIHEVPEERTTERERIRQESLV